MVSSIPVCSGSAPFSFMRKSRNPAEREFSSELRIESNYNAWCPRLTVAMILFGSLVQVKGFWVFVGVIEEAVHGSLSSGRIGTRRA